MDQQPDDNQEDTWEGKALFLPTTHRIAAFWKWLLLIAGPILALLMLWGMVQVVANYQEGRGTHSLWLLLFVLAILAGMVLLSLIGMLLAVRARLELGAEQMLLRGVWQTRRITPADIRGYRLNNGQLLLFLHSRQWPLNLTYFDQQPVLLGWISYYADDLNLHELVQEVVTLHQDERLGADEDQRAARLAWLRSRTRALNWLGYVAAASGFLGAMSWLGSWALDLALPLLIALPVAMLLFALRHRGHVRLDYREGSPYPELLTGWLACSLSLGLISLIDPHTQLGDAFTHWLLPLTALASAVCIYIELAPLRAQLSRQWLHAVLAVCTYVFLAAFWAGGSVYQLNQQLDRSLARWSLTVVVGQRTESQKTGKAYYLKVAPWDGTMQDDIELTVSEADYVSYHPGMPILVGVRDGALQIPWVEAVRPQP